LVLETVKKEKGHVFDTMDIEPALPPDEHDPSRQDAREHVSVKTKKLSPGGYEETSGLLSV